MDDRIESGRQLEALRRKNLEGKKTFIEGLRHQRDPKAISLLLEILCDESWYLRELAVGALVQLEDLAREPLRGVLSSGLWYTRAAAARALGRIGDGVSAPALLEMLADSNRTVRDGGAEAIRALSAAGGTPAIARALLAYPIEHRGAFLQVLDRLDSDLARHVEALMNGASVAAIEEESRSEVVRGEAEGSEAASGEVARGEVARSETAREEFPHDQTALDESPRNEAARDEFSRSENLLDELPQNERSMTPMTLFDTTPGSDLTHGNGGIPPGRS